MKYLKPGPIDFHAPASDAYRDNYDAIDWGPKTDSKKGRVVYTRGGQPLPEPVEVGEDWVNATARTPVVTDLYMDGVAATDGTDIGSRKKRREWMRANDYVDADDYRETWKKQQAEREASLRPEYDKTQRREDVARALYERRKRR